MTSMIRKNPATTKWPNPPFPSGKEPPKFSLPALAKGFALAAMFLANPTSFVVAAPISGNHGKTLKPVDGGSGGGGKPLELLHDQPGGQGQGGYPDLGDRGGEKLTHLHLKDPPIIKDGVMEKAMMDAMDWDSEDGVEEDGHENVSPKILFL